MLRRGVAARNAPKRLQGPEVVETQQIEQAELALQPLQPPAKAAEAVAPPAIDRRPPELTGGGEVVGRNTALLAEAAIGLHREQVAVAPDISAVVGHIEGQIADHLHLTLAFLGNQAKSLLPALARLLDKLPGQSFTLGIDQYGYFSKPRIAWAGPSETPPPLMQLQQSLMHELNEAQVQIKPEGKFRPHVTLARDANSLNEPFAPGIPWRVGKIMLIQSLQVKGGVIYSPIMEKLLA